MSESQKRQIAYKVRIKDILNGRYVKEEGWQPNYIITNDKKISRVNLIGVVVDKQFEFDREILIIDDGSGKITIRTFDDRSLSDLEVGEVILIIGRPKEYNNEKYIMPEILKKIKNKKWIDFRKIELEKKDGRKVKKDIEKKIKRKEEVIKSPSEKIFNLIKELDSGDGVDFDEIINKVNIKKAEKIINNLLSGGEIFQNKPGKLKVLE